MRVRSLAVFLGMLAAASTATPAGEVYGKVLEGAAAAPEGTEIVVKCGEKRYPAVRTDKSGAYHLVVAETGKCTMTIRRGALEASLEFASYEDEAQCDVVLETKDGKLSARRK